MSDRFEDEIRSALRSGVSDELSATRLADGARQRWHRRRRNTTAVVGAAFVLAAVPVGLTVMDRGTDGEEPGPEVTTATESPGGLPADWHWEAWESVELGVPDAWGPGALDQWCVGGGEGAPVVQRPDTIQTLVFCDAHQYGYGVLFDAQGTPKEPGRVWQYTTGTEFPQGSWIANLGTSHGVIVIVTQDRDTAEKIVGSSRSVGDVDAAGCARQTSVPLGTALGLLAVGSGRFALCEYSGTDGSLVRSKSLDAARSGQLQDALTSTADPGDTAMPDCASFDPNGVLVLQEATPVAWVFSTGCSDSRVLLADGATKPWSQAIAVGAHILTAPAALDYVGFPPDSAVTENPDGSVSNDGTVVPPDAGSGSSSDGSGSSGNPGEVQPADPTK